MEKKSQWTQKDDTSSELLDETIENRLKTHKKISRFQKKNHVQTFTAFDNQFYVVQEKPRKKTENAHTKL